MSDFFPLSHLFGLHSRGKGNQSTAVSGIHQASLTGHEHSTGAISAFPESSGSQSNTWLNNIVFFLDQKFMTCITLLNFYFSIHKGRESMLVLKKEKKQNKKKKLDLTKNPVYKAHTSRVCTFSEKHLCNIEQSRPPVADNNQKH